jgi:hypothetical protein
MDHVKPYTHSADYAMKNGELDIYHEDARLNRECVRAIDEAVRACNYETYRHKFSDAVKTAVDAFGFERVTHTLAGAVTTSFKDGRFSPRNHKWAQGFVIHDDRRGEFVFSTHKEVLNGFVDSVRKARVEMLAQEVGQYEKSHRMAERNRLTWFHNDFGVFVPNPGITEERLLTRYEEITEKKAERRSVLDQIRVTHKDEEQPSKQKRVEKSHGTEL